jgi:hypothetical protein
MHISCMASYAINHSTLPECVFDDLRRFIHERYQKPLPNSLLVAQAFILRYPEHGKQYSLALINMAIEDGIRCGLF